MMTRRSAGFLVVRVLVDADELGDEGLAIAAEEIAALAADGDDGWFAALAASSRTRRRRRG